MSSLSAIVTYPRGWVALLSPCELIPRAGRTRLHAPYPICSRDDGQSIFLPLVGHLLVWCVLGDGRPGVRLAWDCRGHIWCSTLAAPGNVLLRRLSHQQPRSWLLMNAGTMHRLLSRVVCSFGLQARTIWFLPAATEITRLPRFTVEGLPRAQIRQRGTAAACESASRLSPSAALEATPTTLEPLSRVPALPLKASVLPPAINCSGAGQFDPDVTHSALSAAWSPPFDQPGEDNTDVLR
jgi:hypothetical protein